MSRKQKTVEAALATISGDLLAGCYFVGADLGGRHPMQRGQLWEWQDKRMIRQWASSFSEDEATPWHEFKRLVVTVTAPVDVVNEIVAAAMTLEQAEAHLLAWAEQRLAQRAAVA
jgi:hypothetical protein